MAKCKKCGEELNAEAYFCTNCGVEVKKPTENPAVQIVEKKVVDKAAVKKAREEGMQAAFRFLADMGMDFDEEIDGEIPIIHAAEQGNVEVIKALLSVGADADATNEYGEDALSIARQNCKRVIVTLLNNASKNKSVKTAADMYPAICASIFGLRNNRR